MGVLSTNRAQITSGGLISASFISDIYDVLTGAKSDTAVFSGSLSVSGSLNISNGITGTLTGTATTASYISGANVDGNVPSSTTASYIAAANIDGTVANATSASSATNAVTASFVASTLQFGTTTTLGTAVNGALAVSSSGDLYFGSASAWYKVTLT